MQAEGNVLQIRAEIEIITKPKRKLEKGWKEKQKIQSICRDDKEDLQS